MLSSFTLLFGMFHFAVILFILPRKLAARHPDLWCRALIFRILLLVLTGGASGLFTDLVVLDGNPADSTLPVDMIARQKKIYGRVPLKAAYDGGFASNTNLEDIKGMGVRDATFRRKRGLKISDMAKSTWVYKRMCNFRAGIEGMISFLKRCFGLRRCTWSGFESFKAYAWSSVITANLLLMARHMLT